MIYNDQNFQIYFGDASDKQNLSSYLLLRQKLKERTEFMPVFNELKLNNLFFLHQVHGTDGLIITSDNCGSMLAFAQKGDFLITDQPHLGIGIMTGDCVPIIAVDSKRKIVAAAHAGWRGAVAGIIERMLGAMQGQWGNQLTDVRFFIGPSAKSCCYQITPDFLANLAQYPYRDLLIRKDKEILFFDVSLLIFHQLCSLGIAPAAINMSYNLCTMCNFQFCSYRRGSLDERQMTVVALR